MHLPLLVELLPFDHVKAELVQVCKSPWQLLIMTLNALLFNGTKISKLQVCVFNENGFEFEQWSSHSSWTISAMFSEYKSISFLKYVPLEISGKMDVSFLNH